MVVLVGVAAGALGGLAGSRYLQSVLFGITARDATSIAVAIGCMLTAAAVAAFLPARRAAGVAPSVALRHQ